MSTRRERETGYHVVVTADVPPWSTQQSICEGMIEQIKRHVDHVEDATVKPTTELYCEACRGEWDDNDPGAHADCEADDA